MLPAKTTGPATHRDLVTAYLLALAGLPFALRRDAAGRTRAFPLPDGEHDLPVKMTFSIG